VGLKDGLESCMVACFEAGIKLGALFHQFVGMPVGPANVELVERAIESCVKLQPFVENVEVRVSREKLGEKVSGFGYTSLSPEMLEVRVTVSFEDCRVKAVLRWVEELKYPLMEVVRVERAGRE